VSGRTDAEEAMDVMEAVEAMDPGSDTVHGAVTDTAPAARRSAQSAADHWQLFVLDAARWVRPQMVADRSEVTPQVLAKLLFRHPPLRAMAWFRLASWLRRRRVPAVPGVLQRRLLRLYGLELSPGADIDGGLYIAHPAGTVVAVERMGRNVSIIAAVTLGTRTDARWPRIGDDVFIGAGARVLGGIDVGTGAVVGANAVVLRDVAPAATVVGVPARPIGTPDRGPS
jgi:serine O-acetyltransferase